MNLQSTAPVPAAPTAPRLDWLDAVRAFALVLGVVFHAAMSFTPWFLGWAVQDVATSPLVGGFILVSHAFRMELFFLIAGFFAQRSLARMGAGEFIRSRVVRLGVPFVAGWFLLRPLLVSGWLMGADSLRGDYDFWKSLAAGWATLRELPAGIFTGSHLWFLYYLLLVTALALGLHVAGRLAARRWPALDGRLGALTGGLAQSVWGLPMLIVPAAGALWFMQYWGMDTPDRSLRPHWPVLAVYGGCFLVGWAFARREGAIEHFGRLTAGRGMAALAGVTACLVLSPLQADPGHPQYWLARAGFVVAYATMMVTLVSLTLGFFRRACAWPNRVVRYVADSSYWMYLIHLPLVVWLQVAVAEIEAPWGFKLAGISAATVAISLLTYDLFVRGSLLGAVLNGRRRERVLFRGRKA